MKGCLFLHERVNEKLSNPLDLVEHKCEQRKNVLAGSAWKFQSIWRSSGSGSYQSLPPLQFQSEAAENCYQICQKESTLYRVKREIKVSRSYPYRFAPGIIVFHIKALVHAASIYGLFVNSYITFRENDLNIVLI